MTRSLNSIFQALVPKDKKFIPLFQQDSANVVNAATKLREALSADSVTRIQLFQEVHMLEKQGDEFTHVIIQESASTFIIPFDREDIQSLAVAMDDIVDYIDGTAKRIELYKIHQIHPAMVKMAELMLNAVKELDHIISQLKDLRYSKSMQESLAKISEYEKEADTVFDDAIAQLFRDESNELEILKMKEVFSTMSTIAERVEDAANVIESVLVKFS
jgi:predicted phosphate transport protein (TIGR00153 family)